jgi:hypothetical protein
MMGRMRWIGILWLCAMCMSCSVRRSAIHTKRSEEEVGKMLYPIVKNGKWGHIDKSGAIVIAPRFDFAQRFEEGLALVRVGDKYGFINSSGEVCIALEWEDARAFSENLAAVCDRGRWGYIDRRGTVVVPLRFADTDFDGYRDGTVVVSTVNGMEGCIDKTGKYVIKPTYSSVGALQDGLRPVEVAAALGQTSSKWGYVDSRGETVVAPLFEAAHLFSEGLGCVKESGKWGYLDRLGRYAIPPTFEDAYVFREGLAGVLSDGRWRFIDPAGKTQLELQEADDVCSFFEGLAAFQVKGKWGFVDKSGRTVVKPIFDSTGFYNSGVVGVLVGDKVGVIDRSGKYVFRPQFTYVGMFDERGIASVEIRGKKGKGYIHKSGSWVWKPPE